MRHNSVSTRWVKTDHTGRRYCSRCSLQHTPTHRETIPYHRLKRSGTVCSNSTTSNWNYTWSTVLFYHYITSDTTVGAAVNDELNNVRMTDSFRERLSRNRRTKRDMAWLVRVVLLTKVWKLEIGFSWRNNWRRIGSDKSNAIDQAWTTFASKGFSFNKLISAPAGHIFAQLKVTFYEGELMFYALYLH